MKNPFELTLAEWLELTTEEQAQAHVEAGRLARATIEKFIGRGGCAYVMLACTPETVRLQSQIVRELEAIDEIIEFALVMDRVPFEFFSPGHESWAGQCFVQLNRELEAAIKSHNRRKEGTPM